MELIKCPECGKEISDRAESCPNCGAIINKKKDIEKMVSKILSWVTTVLTLGMTAISLFVAKQSLDISDMALILSSSSGEPIFEVNIDDENEELYLRHITNEIYKIQFIQFGKVRTMAITNSDNSKINSIEIEEKNEPLPFKIVRSKEAGGLSEEEAQKCNKELKMSLKTDRANEMEKEVEELNNRVKKECNKRKNLEYWGVSDNFDFYYIDITYKDVHDRVKFAYYIYKCEYTSKWQLYRLGKEEYDRCTSEVIYNYGSMEKTKKRVIKDLFSEKNFENFSDSKYDEFWEWFDLRQFE